MWHIVIYCTQYTKLFTARWKLLEVYARLKTVQGSNHENHAHHNNINIGNIALKSRMERLIRHIIQTLHVQRLKDEE